MKRITFTLIFLLFLCLPCRAGDIELAFSPGGDVLAMVLRGIAEARSSVYVAAYSFTSKEIAEGLLAAHRRGVSVRVVADAKSGRGAYSAVTYLANQGVPVRLNAVYAILHHKFMVIDEAHVETGSFNYSAASVKRNAENALLLRDRPDIAGKYRTEWQRLWDESEPLAPKY